MYDGKTDLWMYKPDYDLRTPADLVALLKIVFEPREWSEELVGSGDEIGRIERELPCSGDAIEELSKVNQGKIEKCWC